MVCSVVLYIVIVQEEEYKLSLSRHDPGTLDRLSSLLEKHARGQVETVLPLLTEAGERQCRGMEASFFIFLTSETKKQLNI